jgi:beta-lactamase regulating signal transducer with metallopeptidase domain
MSVLVILYVIGCGALVAGAAAAIEWGVQGRIPTRHLWTVAMVIAVVLPPTALVTHARVTRGRAVSASEPTLIQVVQLGRDAGAAMGAREPGTALHSLRTRFYFVLDRIEHVRGRTIAELWMIASLALIAWIAAGVAHWQLEQDAWEEAELDGVRVQLSDETGPAVLGIVSQRIVLPSWAWTLAPEYRRLMLAHECEHIAARDPQRLALALAALVVMPWNPALWWCTARMRRAVEMDCDARVLRRHPSPREYGYLLLQVAARGTDVGPLAVPLVNLLRLPSELELRLRAMSRPRTIAGRTVLAGAVLAAAAVAAAFTAPVPRIPRLTQVGAPSARVVVERAGRPTAWARVRGRVVQLDSVTVDAKNGITQGVLPLELRRTIARDTLPSAKADDSLRALARALAERTRELDSAQAQLHAMMAVRPQGEGFRPNHFRVRANVNDPGNTEETAISTVGDAGGTVESARGVVEKRRDSIDAALKTYFDQSATRIQAALDRYYPNLESDARTNTVIWFLANSAGNVVRTLRKDGPAGIVSAESAADVFGTVDAKTIESVSIRKWTIGDRRLAVAWIQLKK